ncbi:MAG: ROK family protein, partial [Actinomycetota bacterium]|nr:ROK family protein [Actinomycetota bacterium]
LVTHDVLEEAGRELGIAVANAMTLLNPELLIIGGEGTELGPAFLDPIVSAVHELSFANLGREIEVKIQKWGDEAWAVGAATLVLRETFNIPDADEERQAIWHRLGV